MQILLLSDTHGYLDEAIINHVKSVDEVWHAGDFGSMAVSDTISSFKKIRGVYGNIDGQELRSIYPLHNRFSLEGFNIWITHIGGYPGRYNPKIREEIIKNPPDIFITGHSHIVKIMRDARLKNLIHINPGAAGKEGFHRVRTFVKFNIENKKISDLQVVELRDK